MTDQQQADLRHDEVTAGTTTGLPSPSVNVPQERQNSLWSDAWGEHHLRRGGARPLRRPPDGRRAEAPPLAQGRPALRDDPHLPVLPAQLGLRKLGMQFDLIQDRHHPGLGHDAV